MIMERSLVLTAVVVAAISIPVHASEDGMVEPAIPRGIPQPLPHHPGNIFLVNEDFEISAPDGGVVFRVLNDTLETMAKGATDAGKARVAAGALNIGWYRVEFLDAAGEMVDWTTAAVLAPFAEPVPQDSPICIDGALSWYDQIGKIDGAEFDRVRRDQVSLATLAGANWIRDRIHWREVEIEQGTFVPHTKYDDMADIQFEAGLKVLQVFHIMPKWAVTVDEDTGTLDRDLRHVYRFCEAMAKRFEGRVLAWEPWNEGNAHNFGAFPIDALCSLQKAAYLGFKTGDADLTVGWNPLGGINGEVLTDGILANETWPYYDTYNLHTYDWPHSYDRLWEHARDAASGRPMWVTEADRGMKADPDSELGDYIHENAVLKAQYMAQAYALSQFAGSSRHFHFILGDYMEGQRTVQFGLLRKDMTPRPSYVALAAMGRLLAGAQCLGRIDTGSTPGVDVNVIAFRGRPNGREGDVLVCWAERQADWPNRGLAKVPWPLPHVPVEAAYDYLGRPIKGTPDELGGAPVFVVLPKDNLNDIDITPARTSVRRDGAASSIVMQVQSWEREPVIRNVNWVHDVLRTVPAGETVAMRVWIYNFGDKPVTGTVRAEAPDGIALSQNAWKVALEPMGRMPLDAQLSLAKSVTDGLPLLFRGDFGDSDAPALAFEVHPRAEKE
ncbi:MAG: hypothetical protein GY851_28385 [bacterium]|nr:hypothetical protein [bacterium]